MKTLLFNVTVPDKNDESVIYEAGKTYDFDDARADEILAKRTRVTGEPFAVEYEEESETEEWAVTEENDGVHVRPVIDGEIVDTPVKKVEKPKRGRKKDVEESAE